MAKACLISSVYHGTKPSELEDFFDSVFSQTVQAFDIFIALDGPVSKSILNRLYSLQDNPRLHGRLFLFEFPLQTGLASCLNRLILRGLSHGYEYFIRADTDDKFSHLRVERLLSFAIRHPEVDVVGSSYQYFQGINSVRSLPRSHEEIVRKFVAETTLCHASVMFRKSFFLKAGLYSPGYKTLMEDQRLWFAGIRCKCVFANTDEVLYFVRSGSGLPLRRLNLSLQANLLLLRLQASCYLRPLPLAGVIFLLFKSLPILLVCCLIALAKALLSMATLIGALIRCFFRECRLTLKPR